MSSALTPPTLNLQLFLDSLTKDSSCGLFKKRDLLCSGAIKRYQFHLDLAPSLDPSSLFIVHWVNLGSLRHTKVTRITSPLK